MSNLQSLPDPSILLVYALCFLRISGVLFALPLFGDAPTPVRVRILYALALTLAMQPLLPKNWAPQLGTDLIIFVGYVLRELLIGLVLGYLARIAFDGLLMAANLVAYQMGFGTATLFMPEMGGTVDAFTVFHRMMTMLIFLSLGLHHVWIRALAESFRVILGGAAMPQSGLGILLLELTATIFTTAVQLAAPILVALLFAMAALGLVARTVPQMNVFNMSFPLSFFLGLVIYIATMPLFSPWMQEYFADRQEGFFAALRLMKG